MPERRIGAVVAEEEDQRVLGDAECVEMVEHVAERLVHALDQGGEGLGGCGFAGVLVMSGETRIGMKRRVDGVVGQVEKERLAVCDRLGDVLLGLDGQGLGEKGLGAVVFLEVRNGVPTPRLVPWP